MLEIVSVRHLPTRLNASGVLQGRIDEDISEPTADVLAAVNNNKIMIASLGPFDLKFTSTLRRTISTARVYGFPDAIREPMLNELDFGEFEGKLKSKMEVTLGMKWHNEPQDLVLGEPLRDLEDRIRSFVDMCSNYHRVLVFGHGAWTRALMSLSTIGDINKMNKIVIGNNDLKIARFP